MWAQEMVQKQHLNGEDILDGHGKGLVKGALRRGHIIVHRLHELQDLLLAQRIVLSLQCRQRRAPHDRDVISWEPVRAHHQ